MATMAAIGIQSALGSLSPKEIATAIDTAMARMTANRISGRVSGRGEISPGISATGPA